MYPETKTVHLEKNGIYRCVGYDEVIMPFDFVRWTDSYTGSDDYHCNRVNLMNWQYAKDAMPYWVGKTTGQLLRRLQVADNHIEILRSIIDLSDQA